MTKHAWTVVCSKSSIDRDSNNISLDVTEQLTIQGAVLPQGKPVIIPRITLTVVSLWYRDNSNKRERSSGRIKYLGPRGSELGTFALDLNLEDTSRLRTRVILPDVPVKGSGWHSFVVEQKIGKKWIEVARIPYEVVTKQVNKKTKSDLS